MTLGNEQNSRHHGTVSVLNFVTLWAKIFSLWFHSHKMAPIFCSKCMLYIFFLNKRIIVLSYIPILGTAYPKALSKLRIWVIFFFNYKNWWLKIGSLKQKFESNEKIEDHKGNSKWLIQWHCCWGFQDVGTSSV